MEDFRSIYFYIFLILISFIFGLRFLKNVFKKNK
jgi:hypothetical protein